MPTESATVIHLSSVEGCPFPFCFTAPLMASLLSSDIFAIASLRTSFLLELFIRATWHDEGLESDLNSVYRVLIWSHAPHCQNFEPSSMYFKHEWYSRLFAEDHIVLLQVVTNTLCAVQLLTSPRLSWMSFICSFSFKIASWCMPILRSGCSTGTSSVSHLLPRADGALRPSLSLLSLCSKMPHDCCRVG